MNLFYSKDNKRVVLNGQESDIQYWCASGFNSLVHYFFLIYINELSDNLETNVKLFADDASMFSAVSDPISASQKPNKDHDKVGPWANKWKMSFNPDPSKQAEEVIFFTEDNQSISPTSSI